jgi:hypothetical protein
LSDTVRKFNIECLHHGVLAQSRTSGNASRDVHAKLSIRYGFESLAAAAAAGAVAGVLQTFLIGRHFLIPTVLLVPAILLGNLAWYGFQNRRWAKYLLFWLGLILASHVFFALFWAKRYREILGSAFEPVFVVLAIALAALTYAYARKNGLFRRP